VAGALDLLGIEWSDSDRFGTSFSPRQLIGRCPFHDDRRPSFSVHSSSGKWYCFAGCGGGSLEWLVVKLRKVTIGQAQRWTVGIDSMWVPCEPAPEPELEAHDEDEFFDRFTEPPSVALADRGISAEAAADLSIRWDRDRRAWVLPAFNPDTDELIGWQFKSRDLVWTELGTKKSRTLFGIDVFKTGTPAVLLESPLDVAVLRTAGLEGGLASFGADVSRRQLRLLAERASRIVVALDNDDAGRKFAEKIAASEELAGKTLFQFNYDAAPDCKDPGEMEDEEIREGLRTAKKIRKGRAR
jgi:hypothetical protein